MGAFDPKSRTKKSSIVSRRTLQMKFALYRYETFVTFVTSGFAAHIGISAQSLVSDGRKTKTRLVPPRALHPDRNSATCIFAVLTFSKFSVLTFSKFLLYIRQYSEPRIEGITGSCFLAS